MTETILNFASWSECEKKSQLLWKGIFQKESHILPASPQPEGFRFAGYWGGNIFLIDKCKIVYQLTWRRYIYGSFLLILWVETIISFAFVTCPLPWHGLKIAPQIYRGINKALRRQTRTWQTQNWRDVTELPSCRICPYYSTRNSVVTTRLNCSQNRKLYVVVLHGKGVTLSGRETCSPMPGTPGARMKWDRTTVLGFLSVELTWCISFPRMLILQGTDSDQFNLTQSNRAW